MVGGISINRSNWSDRSARSESIWSIARQAGTSPPRRFPLTPGYQVPFAEAIRKGAGILTGAVGLITTGEQAEATLAEGKSDLIFLAREFLRDPYFPLHVAARAGVAASWPAQYLRAATPNSPLREPFKSPPW